MPARLPYMQFYPADWCRDTFKLSLAARGAWIDLCCHLWTSDTGEETNTIPEWSRLLRSTEAETLEVLTALIDTGVASGVRESGPSGSERVTIRCRRIFNDKAERERKRIWKASRDGSGKVAAPVAAPFQTQSEQNRTEQSQNRADQNRKDNTPPGKPAATVPRRKASTAEHDVAVKLIVEPLNALTVPWKQLLLDHCEERKRSKKHPPHTQRSLKMFVQDLMTWPTDLATAGLKMAIKHQWRIAERAWVEKELGAPATAANQPRLTFEQALLDEQRKQQNGAAK